MSWLAVLIIVTALRTTSTQAIGTAASLPLSPPQCVDSCVDRSDGPYQSCHGCSLFATCMGGFLYDRLACPDGKNWNDAAKKCDTVSDCLGGSAPFPVIPRTSTITTSTTTRPSPPTTSRTTTLVMTNQQPFCVSNCQFLVDGDYPSCLGCALYATCYQGSLYDGRPCPPGSGWNDITKACDASGSTCVSTRSSQITITSASTIATTPSTRATMTTVSNQQSRTTSRSPLPAQCVDTCTHLVDGNYQSCHGCDVFITCYGGYLYDDRPCPKGRVWDDVRKRCETISSTCGTSGTRADPPADPLPLSPPQCVNSCVGRSDGPYQSCHGCSLIATCVGGFLHDRLACPNGQNWNDDAKKCDTVSNCLKSAPPVPDNRRNPTNPETSPVTFPSCVTSCAGRPNGHYQSCGGCTVFATCFNGVLYDNRPCGPSTFWDDREKACTGNSSTCRRSRPRVSCVSSCRGLSDGNYQSCQSCYVYATCFNGALYDNRPCSPGTVWDDNAKGCLLQTDTCSW